MRKNAPGLSPFNIAGLGSLDIARLGSLSFAGLRPLSIVDGSSTGRETSHEWAIGRAGKL